MDAGTGRYKIPHCVTAADERRFPTVSIGGCGRLLRPAVSGAAVWLWQLRALCLLPPAASGSGCWDASTASERPGWVLTTVTQTPDTEWAGPVTPALRPSSRYAPSYRAQTARHARFHSIKKKKKSGRSIHPRLRRSVTIQTRSPFLREGFLFAGCLIEKCA